jgi:PAS domain S-box-containing protein
MEDKGKSREQLIQELDDTRRKLARQESEEGERQVMEAVLRESEERFRTIFDSSLDIIMIADTETRKFLGGNTVAQKVLGYTPQEFRNLRVMDIHPKADVPRVGELFERMARRETFAGENVPIQCKDGRVFYADLMSSVITLAGKQYLLGIFRDLTEIKRMEDKVRKTEEVYHTIITHSPDYIYVNDINGYFLEVSPALLAKIGLSQEKIQKKTFMDLFSGENLTDLLQAAERLKNGQAVQGLNIRTRNARGEVLDFEVNAVPLFEQGRAVTVLSMARDVTEQKRIQEELIKSEERYRSLVNNIPDVVWTNDTQGNTIYISPNIAAIYGYTQEEIYQGGKEIWLERIHPEDRERVWRSFQALFTQRHPYNLEYRIQRKDGDWIWLHTRSTAVYEKGGAAYADGIFSDVSRRKQTELALHESEEKYRRLLETSDDMIFTVDPTGNFTFVNPALEKHLGYTREELLAMNGFDFIHPDDRETLLQAFLRVLENRGTDVREYRYLTKSGSYINISASASIIYGKEGNPVGILGIARNITDQKIAEKKLRQAYDELENRVTQRTLELTQANQVLRLEIAERQQAEQALRESEEMYRTLVETSPDVIATTDLEGRIIQLSSSKPEFIGLTSKELAGLDGFAFIAPEDQERARIIFQKILSEGSVRNIDYQIVREDGTHLVIELNAALVKDSQGKPKFVIAAARDISDRKQSEEALRESEEMYKILAETSSDAIFTFSLEGSPLYASPRALKMFGYQSFRDSIGLSGFGWVAPEDRDKALADFQSVLANGFSRNIELKFIRKDKSFFYGELNAALIRDTLGQFKSLVVMIRDVTERKQIGNLLYAQRDLGVALSATTNLDEALRLCLDSAIQASGMDSGGIYLVNEQTGAIDLAFSRGISPEFVQAASHYDASSPNARAIQKGKPIFSATADLDIFNNENNREEGLRALALIPISFENRVIACLNIASHVSPDIPMMARHALLGISVQIGHAIARIRMENALRESEEMYKALTETSSDGIYVTDLNGKFVDLSRRALEIFGYSNIEEMRGMNGFDLLYPDDRELAAQGLQESLVAGHARNQEFRLVRKDKSIFWGDLSSILLRDKNGNPKYFVCMGRDISERKRAEQALRASEEMYRTLTEATHDAIGVTGLDGTILWVSPRSVEMIRARSAEEIVGTSGLDLVIPEHREEAMRNLARAGQEGSALGEEYTFVRRDQSTFFGEMNAVMVKDSAGNPDKFIVTIRDITERKRAEESLRESEEMYRTLTETSPDAVAVSDPAGKVLQVSRRALEMFGYRGLEELIGKNILDFIAPEEFERARANTEKLMRYGVIRNLEYTLIRKDGTCFTGEVNSALLRNPQGKPQIIIRTIRDITERKQAETELVRIQKAVESSGDAIGISDSQGRHFYQNKAFSDLFGFSINEIGGPLGAVAVFAKPEEGRKVFETIMRGDSWKGEVEMNTKDKRRIPVVGRANAIKDNEGNIIGLIGIFTDITERKRAEETIRESEEMYKTLIETSSDSITVVDMEGKILQMSDQSMNLFGGKTQDNGLRKSAFNYISPEFQEQAAETLRQIVKEGFVRNHEFTFIREDRTHFFGELSAALTRDPAGKPRAIICTVRDITERKRAEEDIRKSEELYRTLVHTSPDAIIVTDLEGKVIEASQKNLELTGYADASDLVGANGFKGIAPEDREKAAKVWQKILKDGFARNVEYNLMKKDGSRFLGEVNATLLKNAEGKPQSILAVIRDITERKRLEKEILEISAREQRRIGQDLHDGLSQHLTAISFMNKSLENKLAAKAPAEAKDAAKISQLVSQAITQTRALARGLYPVEHKAEGLMSSLKQLAINLESMFGISCLFQSNKRIFIEDNLISTNLYYIAQEAANNAIKHGKAKHVKIRLSSVKNKLTMTISDDGAGIPKNLKANGGMGLQIMEYRSRMIGASFNVQPGRTRGTLVTCSLSAPPKSLH